MKTPTFLKVNEPGVVFETIDGETILMNLDSGFFFNLEGSGEVIWKFILETGNVNKAIAIMTSANRKIRTKITSSVNEFVTSLLKEKLVVPADGLTAMNSLPETEELLKASAMQFSPPKVNKHTDKQNILFLSASYYVQEKGWPESIENTGLIAV